MKKSILDLRNVLLLLGVSFMVAWYAGLFKQSLAYEPKGGVDYLAYYSAGYIIRYDDPSQLYNVDLQRAIQSKIISLDLLPRFYPHNHPPIIDGILGWVTDENYNASYFRWDLVLFIFHSSSLIVLISLMRFLQWKKREVWILGLSGLLFYPAIVAYLKGQDSNFLLLAISLWTFGLLTSRDRVAGLGLALALVRPQVALVLAIPFLFKRRKVWWWFAVFGLVLLFYCYLLVGWKGLMGLAQMLKFSGQGLGFDVNKMATLMGALLRFFPNIDPQMLHIIGYSGYALALIILCILWAKSHTIEFKHIGLAILLSMVFAPHMHNHDWILLLIPALGAATILAGARVLSQRFAALLPMSISLVILVNDIFSAYTTLYLLILVLALLLWFPGWFKMVRKESPG